MRLQKHHLFLLLPPSLILATWYWTTPSATLASASSSSAVVRAPFSIVPLVAELDSGLARLYTQLGLSKPVRVYPLDLTDQQRRRFVNLRAPTTSATGAAVRSSTFADDPASGQRPVPAGDESNQVYYFASNLLNAAAVLPDMIASLAVLATFLGPAHIFISIVEGPSRDGTGEILNEILRPRLLALGVPEDQISIRSMKDGDLDWSRGGGNGRDRIEVLAELRNVALEPLVAQAGTRSWGPVVFFNDVLFSAAHVLELLHRHKTNEASMTCAWDVLYNPPTLFSWRPTTQFYDSWVGRTLNGATFFPVGAFKRDWKPDQLFGTESSPTGSERAAYESSTPFAVFSCFNGISIFDPVPFLPPPPTSPDPSSATPPSPPPLRFRAASLSSGEMAHSEALLIGRDLWRLAVAAHRPARIQVVPGVKVGYEDRMARLLLSEAGGEEIGIGDGEEKIDWSTVKGPEKIMGYGWPKEGVREKGNPWLHGEWVDALYG